MQEWNLDHAVDAYFRNGPTQPSAPKVDIKAISSLFDKYKDLDDQNIIGVEGTELICQDLELDPTNVETLVLAWHLKCENMCEFKRQSWIEGWTELECDTLEKMKTAAFKFNQEINDQSVFKQVYIFTFQFARNEGQKSLTLETALAFWQLLLNGRFKDLEEWFNFLKEKHGKAISKDTWNLFYDFVENVADDYSGHDFDGAWPVLIDTFVTYMQEKRKSC